MEIEYLNSILYLQYNTIAEEAHSHPVCEGFFNNKFINYTVNSGVQDIYIDILATFSPGVTIFSTYFAK